jgi:hypothetical protein
LLTYALNFWKETFFNARTFQEGKQSVIFIVNSTFSTIKIHSELVFNVSIKNWKNVERMIRVIIKETNKRFADNRIHWLVINLSPNLDSKFFLNPQKISQTTYLLSTFITFHSKSEKRFILFSSFSFAVFSQKKKKMKMKIKARSKQINTFSQKGYIFFFFIFFVFFSICFYI